MIARPYYNLTAWIAVALFAFTGRTPAFADCHHIMRAGTVPACCRQTGALCRCSAPGTQRHPVQVHRTLPFGMPCLQTGDCPCTVAPLPADRAPASQITRLIAPTAVSVPLVFALAPLKSPAASILPPCARPCGALPSPSSPRAPPFQGWVRLRRPI